MAEKSDAVKTGHYSYYADKVLVLGKDGINMASTTNPLPVDAIVTVDSMDINAEMKVDSGHDLYVPSNISRSGTLAVTFDSVSGLELLNIHSVENKTQGWIYSTKGATVTDTSISLVAANQGTGYPEIGAADEVEVVYRGTSRLTNNTQTTKITDGTSEIDVITNADVWQPGTTDLTGFGVYGYDSSNNIAKPLKLNSDGELMVDAEVTMEEIRVGSEDDTSTNAHYLKTDASGQLINVEVIQSVAGDLNMTEANSSSIKTAVELIDDSVYTDGTGTPSKGVAIMGSDGTNPQFISTDNTGAVNINDISGTISLPTDAATETTLALIEGKDFATETTLSSIDGNITKCDTDNVVATVSATDLDIRDLAYSTDSVTAHQGGTWSVTVSGSAATTATNTKVSVGSSSTSVLALNASRKFAIFVNDSDETIYLNLSGTAVMNEGIRLNANGGSYEINLNNLYTGVVTGICSSGTKNLTVVEG